ncbi:methyltransferase domain-containing protein [Candidatus Puniceispirillum sp.]|nr:methyltransferase domain-containing protein [Candidatus Puniceispirillum sp.]
MVSLLQKQPSSNSYLECKLDLLLKGAVERHQKGNLEAANLLYQEILRIDPENTSALQLSGTLACQLQQHDTALNLISKAIFLEPNYVDAYFNRAGVLKEIERYEEALDDYDYAISIKPDYYDAIINRGYILLCLERYDEALAVYNNFISLKPNSVDALINRGVVLQNLQKFSEALIDFKAALFIDPSNQLALYNLGLILKGFQTPFPDPELMNLMEILLDKKTLTRPSEMLRCGTSLLKADPILGRIFKKHSEGKFNHLIIPSIQELSKNPLLLKFMELCPISDLQIEGVLKKFRSFMLLNITTLERTPNLLRFQNALALQCFTNEFLYETSSEELKALKDLEHLVKNKLASKEEFDPFEIACIASYSSLQNYRWHPALAQISDLKDIYNRQILEPQEENNIKFDIPIVNKIKNDISVKVRQQYEINPYPRWINASLTLEPKSISNTIKDLSLKIFDPKINAVETPRILVAGCGTGQHSIETSSRFKNSAVLAIDISLNSLAYAKRKTNELGIRNIEYMHCDILEAQNLGEQFDIIESMGVLHHMSIPIDGWESLVSCLKPGGLMRIGLYSEMARQDIKAMRDEHKSIKSTLDKGLVSSIKSIRSKIINSVQTQDHPIFSISDFYSLSGFRDLALHVQEQQFTIPMIKANLKDLGLKFIGFEDKILIRNFKLKFTDPDDLYDLDKWHNFEIDNPMIFIRMYQFWCQKCD